MAKQTRSDEAIILKKFRSLSPERKQEAIDFLDFLTSGEMGKDRLEFDEWALNLAREKGFNRLTRKDVACIVSDFRNRN